MGDPAFDPAPVVVVRQFEVEILGHELALESPGTVQGTVGQLLEVPLVVSASRGPTDPPTVTPQPDGMTVEIVEDGFKLVWTPTFEQAGDYELALEITDAELEGLTAATTLALQIAPDETSADGDALPDSWEINFFGGTAVANGGEDEDFDGDGATNIDEFRAGTDPSDPISEFGLRSGFGLEWFGVKGRTYVVERSTDNWVTVVQVATVTGEGRVMEWVDADDAGEARTRLYRVIVQ